jgi:hypothetical protein
MIIQNLTMVAGESWSNGQGIYGKYDGVSAFKGYVYTADATDSDNDTYPIMGIAKSDESAAASGLVFVGQAMLMRRDEFSFTSADLGKALYPAATAGGQSTTGLSDPGDHKEQLGIVVGVNGVDGVTGDYILYRVPNAMVVVPA